MRADTAFSGPERVPSCADLALTSKCPPVRQAEEEQRAEAEKVRFSEHHAAVVARAEAVKAEREKALRQRSTTDLAKEMETEQRRARTS